MYSAIPSAITKAGLPALTIDPIRDLGTSVINQNTVSNSVAFQRASGRGHFTSGLAYTVDQAASIISTNNFIRNSEGVGGTSGTVGAGAVMPTNWSITKDASIMVSYLGTSTVGGKTLHGFTVSGIPTGSPHLQLFWEGNTNITAANADVRTLSCYVQLSSGSLSGVTGITLRDSQRDSGGTAISDLISSDNRGSFSATLTRIQAQLTCNSASVAYVKPNIVFSGSGSMVSYTVWIGSPQEEKYSSATTYIPTSGSAGTGTDTVYSDAQNAYAIDYNYVTGDWEGIPIEETRTNGIRNSIFAGGVAGTIGSGATVPTNMTITMGSGATGVIAFGTENGMECMDVSVSGASVTSPSLQVAFETTSGIAALQNQTWTESAFLKLVTGDFTNVSSVSLRQIERSSGGTNLATNTSSNLQNLIGSSMVRFDYTATLGNASTAFVQPFLVVSNTGTPAISYKIRIYGPQQEQGAFPTTYIKSSGTAGTRATERGLLASVSSLIGSGEGAILIEHKPRLIPAATDRSVGMFSDNSSTNVIGIRAVTDQTADGLVVTGGVTQSSFSNKSKIIANAPNKTLIAWKANDLAVVNNGQSIAVDTSATIPTVTQLALGDNGYDTANHYNGWIRGVTIFKRKPTTSDIQKIFTTTSSSVDTIIIAGQSNADGRGDNTTMAAAVQQFFAKEAHNVYIFMKPAKLANGSPSGGTVDPTNFVNDGTWWKLGTSYSTTKTAHHQTIGATVGQGISDSAAYGVHGIEMYLAYLHQQAYPGRELRIIKAGVSNSAIEINWKVTNADAGYCYDFFKNYVYTPAVNAMLAQGKTPNIIGLYWMQGEADAGPTEAPNYATRLQALVNRFNSELYMRPKKIAIGRLGSTTYGTGDGATVRAAQATVAGQNANTVLIDTDSAALNGDNIHYSSAGQQTIANLVWTQFNS